MSSKKEYLAVSAILASFIEDPQAHPVARSTGELIATRFAIHFAAERPEFDRARFLAACGCGVPRSESEARVAARLAEGRLLKVWPI